MSKLTRAKLDRAVANALGLKSVNNCEKWRNSMIEDDDDIQDYKKPWVGLTVEEIRVIDEATWDEDHKTWGIHDFARAIEAKLKEKNT